MAGKQSTALASRQGDENLLDGPLQTLLNRGEVLTEQQFSKLFRQYRKGNQDARSRIIASHSRFALQVARRYMRRGIALPDLFQFGLMGLDEALRRYVPSKGKYLTYAAWWVRSFIERAFREDPALNVTCIPVNRKTTYNRIRREDERLKPGGGIDDEELLEHILSYTSMFAEKAEKKEPEWRKEEVRRWIREYRVEFKPTISLDAPVRDGDQRTIGDLVAAQQLTPEMLAMHTQARRLKEEILEAVRQLPHRDVAVLSERFGLHGGEPQTLQTVGDQFGISRERIRQVEAKALRDLAKLLNVHWTQTDRVCQMLEAVGEMMSGQTRGRRLT